MNKLTIGTGDHQEDQQQQQNQEPSTPESTKYTHPYLEFKGGKVHYKFSPIKTNSM